MILDTFANAKRYFKLSPGLAEVLEAIGSLLPSHFPAERMSLRGEDAYLLFAEYDTHDRKKGCIEAHRTYLDVMYMVEGEETVYIKPTDRLRHIVQPYHSDKDALLAEIDEDVSAIRLEAGNFLILFPEDAHAPGCYADEKKHIKKIIGKVRIA